MEKDKRRQVLHIILLTIICLIVVGISLPDLVFQPALPFPGAEPDSVDVGTPQTTTGSPNLSFPWLFQLGLALGIILLFLALITALFKKVNLKRVVILASVLAALFALFSILPNLPTIIPNPIQSDTHVPMPPQMDYLTSPIGDPPAKLFLWVKVFLLLAISILMGWLVIHIFKQKQKENAITVEVESAILAITNGGDLGGIIVRCYSNMEKIVSQERGIDRNQSVTPHEFQNYLIREGIPIEPILQLTTLFEKARYGKQSMTEQDEHDALNSLAAIQKVCQFIKKEEQ